MRDFSKVSLSLWRSRKFKGLPDIDARYVYLYLLTCPDSNSIGCFEIDCDHAALDLRLDPIAFAKAMDSLSIAYLIDFDPAQSMVFLTNWDKFNLPTNAKHALGILDDIKRLGEHRFAPRVYESFRISIAGKSFLSDRALIKAMDSLSIAYGKPMHTQDKTRDRQDLDLDKTRQDLDLEAQKDLRAPLRAVALNGNGLAAEEAGSRLSEVLDAMEAKGGPSL
jgi:hypothetical protein